MVGSGGRPTSSDAFIVLPGIMGSTLVEAATGRTLWGFSPRVYVDAWMTGRSLADLAVTEDERAGKVGRVRPAGLLTLPGYAPGFLGLDKYTRHLQRTRQLARHPDAVLPFPYDWRLSVEVNARLLARTAAAHLEAWRSHAAGDPAAKLVILAHSMGGLVARYFTGALGGDEIVRTTITLGTPYYGSVIPPIIMSTGRGAPVPLPHRRMKRLVRDMPGMHDLLPFYRSVRVRDRAESLTPEIVADLGGDAELARESRDRHESMIIGEGDGLRLFVGIDQPTPQSFSIRGGVATPLEETFDPVTAAWVDRMGDGTVPRPAANVFSLPASTILETHASLPRTDEANAAIRDIVLGQDTGPPLAASPEGVAGFGVSVSDVIPVDRDVVVRLVRLPDRSANLRIVDLETNRQVAAPLFDREDGRLVSRFRVAHPGLYGVTVRAGSGTVHHTVMVTPPDAHERDEI